MEGNRKLPDLSARLDHSKTNTLLIRTPEGIVFSQLLAGPVTRFAAWIVDVVCVSVVSSALGMVIGFLSIVSLGVAQAIQIILFVLIAMYCTMHELVRVIGKEKVLRIFFGPMPAPEV